MSHGGFTMNYYQCKNCLEWIGVVHEVGRKTTDQTYDCPYCDVKINGKIDLFEIPINQKEKVIFT